MIEESKLRRLAEHLTGTLWDEEMNAMGQAVPLLLRVLRKAEVPIQKKALGEDLELAIEAARAVIKKDEP